MTAAQSDKNKTNNKKKLKEGKEAVSGSGSGGGGAASSSFGLLQQILFTPLLPAVQEAAALSG